MTNTVRTDYTINSANKTITFAQSIVFEKIYRIINLTKEVEIYYVEASKITNLSLSGNTLYLDKNTNIADNDKIRIEYTETAGAGGSVNWGGVGGNISNQTDLIAELNDKEDESNKVTDFSTPNNTSYPTTQAVVGYVGTAVGWVHVRSLSDLPAPVSGVIQLENNKTYRFIGLVNVGTNQISLGVSNTILGFDKSDDGVVYTGTDDLFIATNKAGTILNITIVTPNGGNFNILNSSAESFQIRECIHSGLRLGTISGGNVVAFNNNIIGNLGNLTFTGTINKLAISTNFFLGTTNLVRQIHFNSLNVNNIIVTANNIVVDTGKIGIEATNVTLNFSGQIGTNTWQGTGTLLSGINPSDSKWELEANGENIIPTSAGYNPNNIKVYDDDFVVGSNETGEIGEFGWSFTNGQANIVPSIAEHTGVINRIATTDGQVTSFYLGAAANSSIFTFQNFRAFTCIFRVLDLSANFSLQIGTKSDMSSFTPTAGVYFEKLNTDTNFFAVNRNAGVQSRVDTTVAFVQNQWYKVEVVQNVISGNIDFYINGILRASFATNKPISTVGLNLGNSFIRLNAANRTLELDYKAFILKTNTR